MIERSTRISSDCSGYLSFKFPAAISTDFTARIPEQHHHHHIKGSKETQDSKVTKYIFDALLFLLCIKFLSLSFSIYKHLFYRPLLTIHDITEMPKT